jgi:hypothetical protein
MNHSLLAILAGCIIQPDVRTGQSWLHVGDPSVP